jgi:hypothetical protein
MRHMLRASPPRVEEALEALADVAQGARDAASFLAMVRRTIRNADSAASESVTEPATEPATEAASEPAPERAE